MKQIKLREIKSAQPNWFSRKNKEFFGDKEYYAYTNKKGSHYLIRQTDAWTDMFDGIKKTHFRVNEVDKETLKIKGLLDEEFGDLDEAKNFLEEA